MQELSLSQFEMLFFLVSQDLVPEDRPIIHVFFPDCVTHSGFGLFLKAGKSFILKPKTIC